jgi:phosphoglycolate phosphatase-like HAD superfamily hydrolase
MPTKQFLVAIDSDGCVFDAMGIKQRECFCPMMIAYFGLQPVAKYAGVIAGQEMGSKAEHLAVMCEKYPKDKILMIGDAPGDQNAAKKNGTHFYPVNPGQEDKSWKRFHDEAFDKFINATYAGKYENAVIAEFEKLLPEHPNW